MTHNLHIFDIIYYSSTFCPIWHFVPFDVLSHSTFWHSTFCLIRCYFYSIICPIRRFVPFDIFYVLYFVRSTFCPIRHFVRSTFGLIRHFSIRHFVPFDVLSFDVLSIRRLLLRHFVGEPTVLLPVGLPLFILPLWPPSLAGLTASLTASTAPL